MKTSPMHNVGEDQNNSAMFSIIRRKKQNKSYIAFSLKQGAILQCETEVYNKRSRSHNNCSFTEQETMPDRGNCERYTGCAVQKNEVLTS